MARLPGKKLEGRMQCSRLHQANYKPYDGDESFLADATDATNKLWGKLQELQKAERSKGGVLDEEADVVSGLTAYGPGYIE